MCPKLGLFGDIIRTKSKLCSLLKHQAPALSAQTQAPRAQRSLENEGENVLTWLVPILWDWRLWNRAPSRGLVWPLPCGKSPVGVEGGKLLVDSLSYWP